MDMDIFQLLYNHLEERHYNNICQNAKQDANYLKATVLEKASDPTIIEDMDDKQYLFVYELGTIENVPLSQIEYIGNSKFIRFRIIHSV